MKCGISFSSAGVCPSRIDIVPGSYVKPPGRACGCLCFAPGTLVHMADGTTKPIEQVRPGEWVQCRNELTGKDDVKPVDSIIDRHSDDMVKLQIANGSGLVIETITCTPDHPFYVPGRGFVAAGTLTAGTSLVSRSGSGVSVSDIVWEKVDGGYTVYNFSVEADHSYFVGQEAGGVWVHNAPCKSWIAKSVFKDAKGPLWHDWLRAGRRTIGPRGTDGVKRLARAVDGYTHELKIEASGDRILGRLESYEGEPIYIFYKYSSTSNKDTPAFTSHDQCEPS